MEYLPNDPNILVSSINMLLRDEEFDTFEVKAPLVSDRNRYVKEVRLNGKPYTKLYLTHADILAGGTLEFVMSSKPNKKRGLQPEAKPYSMTEGIK